MKPINYPRHMKGAVLWETGQPLSIECEIEIPPLRPGQVLVQMAYSGVCRSQLMEVKGARGEDKFVPHLLGHEGTGRVVAVSDDVSKVTVGDMVILGWIKAEGRNVGGATYSLGDHRINAGAVTTFSTYSIVAENRVVVLPPGIPEDVGVLFGCALPTGAGILLNEIRPRRGASIAVIGLGGVGLSALMASKMFSCDQIIAIDVSPEKLEVARRFGATHSIDASREDVLERMRQITEGRGVDYSVEAAGHTETIELAFEITRSGGGECVFASHPEEGKRLSLDPFQLIKGKNIRGSWGGNSKPDKDVPRLAELYRRGLLPLETLLTKRYALEEVNVALGDLENHSVMRPLIVFNGSGQ